MVKLVKAGRTVKADRADGTDPTGNPCGRGKPCPYALSALSDLSVLSVLPAPYGTRVTDTRYGTAPPLLLKLRTLMCIGWPARTSTVTDSLPRFPCRS